MPIRFNTADGGQAYTDIRVGGGHAIHQVLIDADAVSGSLDADGFLPPGFGIAENGSPAHATGTAFAVVGPEAVPVGDADVFGNVILTGALNADAVEANTGAALAATLPAAIRLV